MVFFGCHGCGDWVEFFVYYYDSSLFLYPSSGVARVLDYGASTVPFFDVFEVPDAVFDRMYLCRVGGV